MFAYIDTHIYIFHTTFNLPEFKSKHFQKKDCQGQAVCCVSLARLLSPVIQSSSDLGVADKVLWQMWYWPTVSCLEARGIVPDDPGWALS